MDNHLTKSFGLKKLVAKLNCYNAKKTHFDNKKPISTIKNQQLVNYRLVSKIFDRKKFVFDKKTT
jgi:hypothetical protein